jgi:DNA-binding IclR family transcriptional regulator
MLLAVRSEEWNNDDRMIGRVAAVLGAFDADDPVLGVSEIARRTGLPKSTTSRIVRGLVASQLLENDGRRVRIGIRVFELGELAHRSRELRRITMSTMVDLQRATRLTVQLSTLENRDQVYVEILRGHEGIAIRSRIGGRVPAYATAGGKAVLAYSEPDVVDRVLDGELKQLGPRTITDPEALRAQLETVRAEGVAYELEESHPGVTCAAAAIRLIDGRPLAALSVTGPAGHIDMRAVGPAVHMAALGVNRRIRANAAFSTL